MAHVYREGISDHDATPGGVFLIPRGSIFDTPWGYCWYPRWSFFRTPGGEGGIFDIPEGLFLNLFLEKKLFIYLQYPRKDIFDISEGLFLSELIVMESITKILNLSEHFLY